MLTGQQIVKRLTAQDITDVYVGVEDYEPRKVLDPEISLIGMAASMASGNDYVMLDSPRQHSVGGIALTSDSTRGFSVKDVRPHKNGQWVVFE